MRDLSHTSNAHTALMEGEGLRGHGPASSPNAFLVHWALLIVVGFERGVFVVILQYWGSNPGPCVPGSRLY
jgi:hypothetical protein